MSPVAVRKMIEVVSDRFGQLLLQLQPFNPGSARPDQDSLELSPGTGRNS